MIFQNQSCNSFDKGQIERGYDLMNINEIAIYLKDKPDYISILNELIDYIILEKKNLYLKTTIIDDWNFTNKKEVEGLEKEYCEDKIYFQQEKCCFR